MPDRPAVFAEKCSTCIFRPGDPMRLGADRFREVVEGNRATGSMLICHTTTYGQAPELGEVMCRGFFDAYAATSQVAQVMERLFGPDWYDVVPVRSTATGEPDPRVAVPVNGSRTTVDASPGEASHQRLGAMDRPGTVSLDNVEGENRGIE